MKKPYSGTEEDMPESGRMIEVQSKDLEWVLTEAMLAIQGVELSPDKKERVKESLQGFLKDIENLREVTGGKTKVVVENR